MKAFVAFASLVVLSLASSANGACSPSEVSITDLDVCAARCTATSTTCGGGTCQGTTCTCSTGYQNTQSGALCVPICVPGCMAAGGTCSAPGVCDCEDPTQSYNPTTKTCAANPLCNGNCAGKICTAASCQCAPQYTTSATGTCVPTCGGVCSAAKGQTCVVPGVCTCQDPTKHLDPTGVCSVVNFLTTTAAVTTPAVTTPTVTTPAVTTPTVTTPAATTPTVTTAKVTTPAATTPAVTTPTVTTPAATTPTVTTPTVTTPKVTTPAATTPTVTTPTVTTPKVTTPAATTPTVTTPAATTPTVSTPAATTSAAPKCNQNEVLIVNKNVCAARCTATSTTCGGGTCQGTTCTCNTGYQNTASGALCVAICVPGCMAAGGTCSAPGVCDCANPTQYYNPTTKTCAANPLCNGNCAGKICTAASCQCAPQYTASATGTCVPTCGGLCSAAKGQTCVVPGVCTCQNPAQHLNSLGTCA